MKNSIIGGRALQSLSLSLCMLFSTLALAHANDDDNDRSHNDLMKKCENRANNTPQRLKECITKQGILGHLKEFQKIADSERLNGLNAGNAGHEKAVKYIVEQLQRAGYQVTLQKLELPLTKILSEPSFVEKSPNNTTYKRGKDYELILNGGSTGPSSVAGKVKRPLNNGCSSTDFAGFDGKVAMWGFLELGFDCSFNEKLAFAAENGAIAVLLIEDEFPKPAAFTRAEPQTIPVIDISSEIGERYKTLIARGKSPTVSIKTHFDNSVKKTYNVLAETKDGNPNNVIMAGGHIDSVGNAGINDNGSGTAGMLEVALQLKNVKPKNKLRFAFWTAEEYGLAGSDTYVQGLISKNKTDTIAVYLNADMIGSPNYGYFLPTLLPDLATPEVIAKTNAVTQLSVELLSQYNITPVFQEDFGNSDHYSFYGVGNIPIGDSHTGIVIPDKTPEEVGLWGGIANLPFEPCYHRMCDNIGNLLTDYRFNGSGLASAEIFSEVNAMQMLQFGNSTALIDQAQIQQVQGLRTQQVQRTSPMAKSVEKDKFKPGFRQ